MTSQNPKKCDCSRPLIESNMTPPYCRKCGGSIEFGHSQNPKKCCECEEATFCFVYKNEIEVPVCKRHLDEFMKKIPPHELVMDGHSKKKKSPPLSVRRGRGYWRHWTIF